MKKEDSINKTNPAFKSLLEQALREMGLASGYEEQQVIVAFKKVLPLSFQKYITQISYKNGILFIRCHSAALKNELHNGKENLINKINTLLGKLIVKEMRII